MAIWEFIVEFFRNRRLNKIERSQKLISNPKAIREDRIGALEYLKNYSKPEVSVPILLKRFDYSLEHGINDAREKEIALKGIDRHGDKALPFVIEHLKNTTRIAWPIKILKKLMDERAYIGTLMDALNYSDVSFNQAVVDRNYDLLCYLADYDLSAGAERIAHFLKDPDERVRFAATEVLIRSSSPKLPELLQRFIFDESAENRRIRSLVIETYVDKGWKAPEQRPLEEGLLLGNIFLDKSGRLQRLETRA